MLNIKSARNLKKMSFNLLGDIHFSVKLILKKGQVFNNGFQETQ